jgi:hypothetical protein
VNRQQSIDGFQVPQAILQKASTLDTNYSSMSLFVPSGPNLDSGSLELLPIFHFAEIASDSPNRTFNVYSDSELLFPDVSPLPMRVDSMYPTNRFLSDRFLSNNKNAYFSLNKTASSGLPPLINALELYSLVRMDNFTTSSDDGKIPNR